MEFPVIHLGQTIGRCTVTEEGLYWRIQCECEILTDDVERLYCGGRRLGVLERRGRRLFCSRRVSKSSMPRFEEGFSLSPNQNWQGHLLGQWVQCQREGETLLFPYREAEPCPCEPLICFFEIRDGFWRLPIREQWLTSAGDNSSCA